MATKTKTTKTAAPEFRSVHVSLPVPLIEAARVTAAERKMRSLNALIRQLLEEASKTTKAGKAKRAA